MKKLIILCIIAISCAMMQSCKSYEQRTMEKEILSQVNATGFAHFQAHEVTPFSEMVKDSLLYYKMKSSWDRCFLELYRDIYNDSEKLEHYENELYKDGQRQKYLNILLAEHPELMNETAMTAYRINYTYIDDSGVSKMEIFDAVFNPDKKMVAYKLTANSKWIKN